VLRNRYGPSAGRGLPIASKKDKFDRGPRKTFAKQVKFITNDRTMNKIMTKAAKHFKVPDEEREHWMSTFAHIVRKPKTQRVFTGFEEDSKK
jgi:hypothetical protein